MRRVVIAGLGLAMAACASTPPPSTVEGGEIARGHALLTRYCGSCHAVGTAGASHHPGAPAFRKLSERYPVEGLAESLAEGMMVGHADMPEIEFPAADVDAIIAYLESIQARTTPNE